MITYNLKVRYLKFKEFKYLVYELNGYLSFS